MKVTWEPRPADTPLYLRITGSSGGEVELKIDPATGMLVQAIVIEEPRQAEATDPLSLEETQDHSPVVDRAPWGPTHGPDGTEYSTSVVSVVEDLGFVRTAHRVELVFLDQKPARYVRCGNVTVALSDKGAIATIRAIL
ncbi:hypothetical protein ACWEO4_40945 [Streptomyces sp. NPDC004393]|uniref:hypothetical protein n=1 Tax=unclassified Streptomyces TaxID=2593676 RepID=UPI0033B5556E